MHRKSLEAAEHLKDDTNNSDHEETTSMRTENSDTSATSSQPPPSQQTHVISNDAKDSQPSYPEDPEAFRNNSIACLRAKAQEHSAKLMNHNLMMHMRPSPTNCDANANNLQVGIKGEVQGIFWQGGGEQGSD